MKKSQFVNKIYWIFPAVGLLMAGISYPFLPEYIVTHWDVSGTPDKTMHKLFLFIIPLVLTFCVFVFTWLPAHSKPKNSRQSARENTILQVFAFLVILLAEAITIAYALGLPVNVKLIACLAVGALLVLIGNFMPKFKQNRWVGVRNSQTMKNETVWYRTQRFGGKILMVCGTGIIAAGITPTVWTIVLLAVSVGGMILAPLLYSFVIAKRQKSS